MQGFPQEVDQWRGFLRISYCLRTIGYCFLEIFVGDKALMEGNKVVMADLPSSPRWENPGVRDSQIDNILAVITLQLSEGQRFFVII